MITNAFKATQPPSGATNALASHDLRQVKAPVQVPTGLAWLWWTLGALAVLLVAYWLWRRWRKRAAEPVPEVVIPPHVRALENLRAALEFLFQPERFCVLVSGVIRVYLEERFDWHAPERTTEEFLDQFQSSPLLSLNQKRSLANFLTQCDLVKFARYEPAEPELRDLYEVGVRLVDETAPTAVAAPTETPAVLNTQA